MNLSQNNYYFDSYALIELIKDSKTYIPYHDFALYTGLLNLAEVYYIILTEFGEDFANSVVNKLKLQILDLNIDIVVEASKFRFKNKKLKLSYADCLGYICAKNNNLKFLTGDDGFRGLENVEFMK